jgi:ADP-glucose pyrophosphorylase
MQAVILAAGEGSRMRPLTSSRPKPMLPLANKPILEHLITECAKAGVRDFVIIVGYKDDVITTCLNRSIRFSRQWHLRLHPARRLASWYLFILSGACFRGPDAFVVDVAKRTTITRRFCTCY